MKEKTNIEKYQREIKRATGVLLALLSLLAFISPNTFLWGFGYVFFYLFGLAGFYFLLPFFLVLGLFLAYRGNCHPLFKRPSFCFGLLCLFLGLLLSFAHAGSGGSENFNLLSSYNEELLSFAQDASLRPLLYVTLSGGILGYLLAALFNLAGFAVPIIVAALFFLLAVVLLPLPLYKKLFFSLHLKHQHQEVKASSNKHLQEIEEEKEKLLYERPSLLSSEEKVEKTLLRTELYHEEVVSPLPKQITPEEPLPRFVSPRNMHESGLREAVFPTDLALREERRRIEETSKEEKAPEPIKEEVKEEVPHLFNEISLESKVETMNLKPHPSFEDINRQEENSSMSVVESIIPEAKEEKPALETLEERNVVETPSSSLKEANEISLENLNSKTPEVLKIEETPEMVLPAEMTIKEETKEEESPAFLQPKAQMRPPYELPPLSLLKDYPLNDQEASMREECEKRAEIINQAFTDLHVGAQVVGFTIGPSVTRYDIQTDRDVSVSSIGKYIQDISVRLGGVATRYEQIVRGRSTSGLEIANTSTSIVSLKDMLSALPNNPKDNLYVPFGKSISGETIAADLSDFPHLLVSGSTGSGKSIFMHALIMTLIMRNRPEDLKIILIDPKRVEFGKYRDLPHLLCPIIKEPSEAKMCFKKLVDEMERRYTLFEFAGVSNIRQYNSEYAPEAGTEKLPFIVVFVDEYADLVDTAKDIGELVVRIAQKARAAGIHLVIATQRPSVNVITGTIKANLPVRVALSVSSQVDSITILGQAGAEELAGHGDMLVDCSLIARNGFTRCQGCMVDNHEIRVVADFIRKEASVHYDPNFCDLVDHEQEEKAFLEAHPAPTNAELKAQNNQNFYEQVRDIVMSQEFTSISRIQREFAVGFPRAGKIFAQLQNEGIVARESSSKGSKVLIHSLDELKNEDA